MNIIENYSKVFLWKNYLWIFTSTQDSILWYKPKPFESAVVCLSEVFWCGKPRSSITASHHYSHKQNTAWYSISRQTSLNTYPQVSLSRFLCLLCFMYLILKLSSANINLQNEHELLKTNSFTLFKSYQVMFPVASHTVPVDLQNYIQFMKGWYPSSIDQ